jgi:hypothetical protein
MKTKDVDTISHRGTKRPYEASDATYQANTSFNTSNAVYQTKRLYQSDVAYQANVVTLKITHSAAADDVDDDGYYDVNQHNEEE